MTIISPRAVSGALGVSMSATSLGKNTGGNWILLQCLRLHRGQSQSSGNGEPLISKCSAAPRTVPLVAVQVGWRSPLTRLFLSNATQNPRPTSPEKPPTQSRRIRDPPRPLTAVFSFVPVRLGPLFDKMLCQDKPYPVRGHGQKTEE